MCDTGVTPQCDNVTLTAAGSDNFSLCLWFIKQLCEIMCDHQYWTFAAEPDQQRLKGKLLKQWFYGT